MIDSKLFHQRVGGIAYGCLMKMVTRIVCREGRPIQNHAE